MYQVGLHTHCKLAANSARSSLASLRDTTKRSHGVDTISTFPAASNDRGKLHKRFYFWEEAFPDEMAVMLIEQIIRQAHHLQPNQFKPFTFQAGNNVAD